MAVVLSLTAVTVSEAGGTKVISQSGTFKNGRLPSVSKSTSSTGKTDCHRLLAVILFAEGEGAVLFDAVPLTEEIELEAGEQPFEAHQVAPPPPGQATCAVTPNSTATIPFSATCVFLFD